MQSTALQDRYEGMMLLSSLQLMNWLPSRHIMTESYEAERYPESDMDLQSLPMS